MKEKVGQVFSIAKDNPPVAGCTISKAVTQGEHQVTYFSLAAGTDISAEIFPYYKLVLVTDGQVNVYGEDDLDCLLSTGEGIVTPINTPLGFKTASGVVYTEILVPTTDKINAVLKVGETFRLADLVPYQADKIINMDLIQSDELKFVVMSFDQGTGLAEHAAPGDAIIFALDGQGIITYEGQDHQIQAGQNFHFAQDGRHRVQASTPFKMALLIDLLLEDHAEKENKMRLNEFNQPIGDALPDFTPGEWPQINQLTGNFVTVEPINLDRHFESAYEFYGPQSPQEQWTYLPMEAFSSQANFKKYFSQMAASKDPYYLAVVDKKTGQVVGTFSLMRIDPQNRSVEMGWVLYGPKLKRSRLATEAQYLVMKYVFEDLHYRRYEWKCDHLNAPSRRAAERLGFKFEGTFRRANVYKGRSRDTDWYSLLAEEYAAMKPKFEQWLAPENFNEDGQQVKSLHEF